MSSPSPDISTPILLHLNKVFFPKGISATVLTDDGSSISVITHDLAARLGLKGTETWETLGVAAHAPKTMHTMSYMVKFPLLDGSFKMIKMIVMLLGSSGRTPCTVYSLNFRF